MPAPDNATPRAGPGRSVDNTIWGVCITALAVAILCLQIGTLLRPRPPTAAAAAPERSSSSAVFVDDRGRPVYPYVIREVQNTVSKNAQALKNCYVDYLERNPEMRDGRMTFDWYVTAEGKAEQVEYVGGGLGDDKMRAAISAAVEKMRFAPPGVRTYVEYTFSFKDVVQQTESK